MSRNRYLSIIEPRPGLIDQCRARLLTLYESEPALGLLA